jgi:hypothetical protein
MEQTLSKSLDAIDKYVHEGKSQRPNLTFEDGVNMTLEWVLGYHEENPMEDE